MSVARVVASAYQQYASQSSYTFAFAAGSGADLAVVDVNWHNSGQSITSVTYDGVDITANALGGTIATSFYNLKSKSFYLKNPPTGIVNVVVTFSGTSTAGTIGATSYSGTHPTTTFGAVTETSYSTTPAGLITQSDSLYGSVIHGTIMVAYQVLKLAEQQPNVNWVNPTYNYWRGGSQYVGGGGQKPMAWYLPGAGDWTGQCFEIFPASVSHPAGCQPDSSCGPFYGTNVSSLSWSHRSDGSNRCVYVAVSWYNASSATCSVTYGGTSMTEIASVDNGNYHCKVFRLLNPDTGLKTVAVTLAASSYVVGGSVSWTGVDQVTSEGSATLATGTSTAPSVTEPASTSGNPIFAAMVMGASANTGNVPVAAGQTKLWAAGERPAGSNSNNGYWGSAQWFTATGGSKAMAWTANGSDAWAALVFEINAAAPAPPVNTVAPAVTGTAQVGQTLTTTNGTWTNTPTSYSYLWKHGDDSATAGAATNSTYVPVAGDIGYTMKCVVTATNADGSAAASSNTTSTVASATRPAGGCAAARFGPAAAFGL